MHWIPSWIPEIVREIRDWLPPWFDKNAVELILLFLLITWLKRERRRLQRSIEYHVTTIKQLVLANRDAVESVEQGDDHFPGIANWEHLRELWSESRDRIEAAIESLDGRVRRKYAQIPRYSYAPIIRRLRDDGAISARAADALLSMNEQFLALRRRPANATWAMVDQFSGWYGLAAQELPEVSIV